MTHESLPFGRVNSGSRFFSTGGEGDKRKVEKDPPGGETDAGCGGYGSVWWDFFPFVKTNQFFRVGEGLVNRKLMTM